LPKLKFDIRDTENWEESPAPGEWLRFTNAAAKYTPPKEEPKEKGNEEKEKEKKKKEESRSLTEMYAAEPELIREVINYWHFDWPQIQFIANHGARTDLKAWRLQVANDPNLSRREIQGKPVQLSKLQLFKFFRKYERQIWEGAEYAGQDQLGSDATALSFIGSLNGAKDIASLNDIGVLAAIWAIEEVCQRIYSEYEENSEAEEGYFLDIWGGATEHEKLHTDVGGYDESIMRRLRSGN